MRATQFKGCCVYTGTTLRRLRPAVVGRTVGMMMGPVLPPVPAMSEPVAPAPIAPVPVAMPVDAPVLPVPMVVPVEPLPMVVPVEPLPVEVLAAVPEVVLPEPVLAVLPEPLVVAAVVVAAMAWKHSA